MTAAQVATLAERLKADQDFAAAIGAAKPPGRRLRSPLTPESK
ncbi:MAG: hypothetical protein U0990_03125 [Candidatus Nanopelagicales bacterium]|nr:hypothetical protein [Candidatus Nanopelagicales bacterium]MDZ4249064.1 hypothetical protein [Candidatus Nanopelagicales bacterium]MDZ7577641.1 hypothetical protein [Candidatus Nanopelagicales bacterium]